MCYFYLLFIDTDNGSAAVVVVAIVGVLVLALIVMASWCLYQHKGINSIQLITFHYY